MYRLREEKEELRRKYLEKRNAMTPEEKLKKDNQIISRFTSLVSYRYSDTLLLYYPTKGEIDTRPLIRSSISLGKRVALPVCCEEGSRMDFYYINLDEMMFFLFFYSFIFNLLFNKNYFIL